MYLPSLIERTANQMLNKGVDNNDRSEVQMPSLEWHMGYSASKTKDSTVVGLALFPDPTDDFDALQAMECQKRTQQFVPKDAVFRISSHAVSA